MRCPPVSIVSPATLAMFPAIYPDGFLPIEAPEVQDYSGAGGVTWKLGDWNMDSSLVYGLNKMDFTIENTLNRSLGAASKTVFDAGGFLYDQLVFNFSGVRGVDVGLPTPLNVALGLEARYERLSDSCRRARFLPQRRRTAASGAPTASGAQVFPGFRPDNAVDKSRSAVGVYADLESRITEKFLASVALREERYSDFGSDLTGKLALRYDFADQFALRGSVQNGFRAPSLQQQYFATTSTNFIGGVPFDITTFPATDPVAAALGAKPLTAEKSVNYSVGAVIRVEKLDVTVDAYRINITNRIVLSENLTRPMSATIYGPRLHRRRRRTVLHQWCRHAHQRRRHRDDVSVRSASGRPCQSDVGWEFQFDRCHPCSANRAARRLESFAASFRQGECADIENGRSEEQVHCHGKLESEQVGSDVARDPLWHGAVS